MLQRIGLMKFDTEDPSHSDRLCVLCVFVCPFSSPREFGVSRKLKGFLKFKWCFKEFPGKFQGSFRDVSGIFKGVSRKF